MQRNRSVCIWKRKRCSDKRNSKIAKRNFILLKIKNVNKQEATVVNCIATCKHTHTYVRAYVSTWGNRVSLKDSITCEFLCKCVCGCVCIKTNAVGASLLKRFLTRIPTVRQSRLNLHKGMYVCMFIWMDACLLAHVCCTCEYVCILFIHLFQTHSGSQFISHTCCSGYFHMGVCECLR